MTAFFALTTAGCLVLLAVYAAHLDTEARRRVDAGLLTQATQISLGVATDEKGLVYSSPPPLGTNLAQSLGFNAIGSSPVGLVDANGIAYSSPSAAWLPSSRTIGRAYDAVRSARTSVSFTAPGHDGTTCRWIALPLAQSDTAIAIVGTSAVSPVRHGTVVLGLFAAVAGLVLAATLAGHLLSSLAMRPAVRQLEQQEQFLREAAHELRTPLATLALIVESGLRHRDTATDALRSVDERLSGMDFLVRSLLARARAEAGDSPVERRPLRLDQLAEVTVGDLHASDRVTIETTDTIVDGNSDLIGQAVRNLVENALRHAPGSTVVVTVADRRITVTDTGPAVHDADAGATSRSGPAPTRASVPAGTGTGLSIVAWVAEVHDAELTFDASHAGGVEVGMHFPPPSGARQPS